ncbi:MAG: DUF1269 domain-containing protein [Clostridia bacterium]|nr:DUF1269 domain-containing protein [Clostridia bacterium]
MYNIIAAIFDVESEGYQAMTQLSRTPIIEETSILQMVLVKRENGTLKVCDSYDSGTHTTDDTLLGGLLGGLVGVLGGPVGMLLMGSYGALVGSLVDTGDALDTQTLMERVADKLQDGDIALIMLAEEINEEEVDNALKGFKVTIARFDAAAIASEVEMIEDSQKEKERLDRKELREAKKEERKDKLEAKKAEISADFAAFKSRFKKS